MILPSHSHTIGDAKVLITADQAPIGGKTFPLKDNVDKALVGTSIQHVLVAKCTSAYVAMKEGRDISLEKVRKSASISFCYTIRLYISALIKAMMEESAECEPVLMDSEDELFVVYTSGTTGDPAGVVHTQAGYLLYAAIDHKV